MRRSMVLETSVVSSVHIKFNDIHSYLNFLAGAAVSGSFLFIIALANSIILWKILKRRREVIFPINSLDPS